MAAVMFAADVPMLQTAQTPAAEYEQRLRDHRNVEAGLSQQDDRLSTYRGLTFFGGVAIAVAASLTAGWMWWLVLLLGCVFIGLVIRHNLVLGQLARAGAAVAYYEQSLQRLNDHWSGQGATGDRYRDPMHLYANDLDLFGDGSLFQLICRARTRLGEDRLADWLLTAGQLETISQRHSAIATLKNELDLRERIALLDATVHDDLDQNLLRHWSQQPAYPIPAVYRLLAVALSAISIAVLIAWFLGMWFGWLLIALAVFGVFQFLFSRRIRETMAEADNAGSGLAILSQVLHAIEQSRFDEPLLESIHRRLNTDGRTPSKQIARLESAINYLNNSLRNQFFAVIAFLLAVPLHVVHFIENWRQTVGVHIPDWLEAVADFEALLSLSGYTYENPDHVVPEIVAGSPQFDGRKIGHPLLPSADCVCNDVHLGTDRQLILISGSNMSGKSTLLRTVGVNTVLALAGAPVRAQQLSLTSVQVVSSMRVQDSLQDGRSLFYSALQRIKAIVDATDDKPLPVLFLLDEILQGTNSHDRRIGAEGVIRTLLDRGNIGLVTTHDLALTEIVEEFDGRAENAHLQDELQDGKMTFDYKLHPGIVTKSNALELMRSMGLDV